MGQAAVRLERMEDGQEALDRSSPLPLYVQMRRRLLAIIATWEKGEDRFYSDDDLCRRFGVSRMTARQAVQELVDEGFLERVKGRGTFLARRRLEERPLESFFDGTRFNGGGGDRPMTVRLLSFAVAAAADDPPDLDPGDRIRHIRRLRFWGPVPVAIDDRYLPMALAAELRREEVERRSLVDYLAARVTLANVEMRLEAVIGGKEETRLLRLLPGDPIMVRHLRYVAAEGRTVMTGRSLYRGDLIRYSFSVPLNPDGTARSSDGVVPRAERRAGMPATSEASGDR